MAKNNRAVMTAWIDAQLVLSDGELTADEAVQHNLDERLDLPEALVRWLWQARSAKFAGVKPAEFLREYILAKFEAYNNGDRSARGDAVEVMTRFELKRRFITYNDVVVAKEDSKDVTSKRGRIEIGHNGKSFGSSVVPAGMAKESFTAENYMNGDYEIFIYGAFPKDFGPEYLLEEERFLKIMKVFENKYEFPSAVAGRNGIASGFNVANERATVQYNDSLRIRFKDYCKANGVLTLGEYIEGKERG